MPFGMGQAGYDYVTLRQRNKGGLTMFKFFHKVAICIVVAIAVIFAKEVPPTCGYESLPIRFPDEEM